MTLRTQYGAAWVFDIYHGSGTVRAATMDLYDGTYSVTLGTTYAGCCLSTDMALVEAADFGFYGVNLAARISGVRFQAITGHGVETFSPTAEWRGVRVRIRHYDHVNNVLDTWAYHGVITDVEWRGREVIFGFSSHVESVLDTLIPTYTIDAADFATATGVGACVPVVYGSGAVVQPQLIGHDTTATATNSGGEDYVVHYGDAATVRELYGDTDSMQSGLEELTQWVDAPGTPTYVDGTTFTVSGYAGLEDWYLTGRPIKYRDTAGGSVDQYTFVSNYAAGTVTVADTGLDAGLGSVQVASEYAVSRAAYAIDGTNLTTVRLRTDVRSGLVAYASTATTNPASVIKDILENTDYGLGQTCDATTFATAVTALATAGLGSAVQGALGWDGRQRRARDVLNELCGLYGIKLWFDAADNKWKILVDTQPAAAAVTFGLGDGWYENIESVDYVRRPSMRDAVSTLELKYGQGGFRSSGQYFAQDWSYAISRSVLSVGRKTTIVNPWLRDHTVAKRVLWYRGKTIEHGDVQIGVTVGMEARDVTIGAVVSLDESVTGFNDDYRVVRIERRLNRTTLHLVGYDDEIFTFSDDVTTPTEPARLDATSRPSPQNLLRNPDFSPAFLGSTFPGTGNWSSPIQYWANDPILAGAYAASVTRTVDPTCIGGYYLTLTTDSVATGLMALSSDRDPGTAACRFSCVPGETYCFSCYSDVDAGLRFGVYFFTAANALVMLATPGTLCSPAETNGAGWKRYYAFFRAPATAASFWPALHFLDASTTYKVDAVQLELASRYDHRPTAWRRNLRTPANEETGQMLLRREAATTVLSGASKNLVGPDGNELIPAGAHVRGVTVEVMANITYGGGGTKWSIGDSMQPGAWGSELSLNTAGDKTDATSFQRVNSLTYTAASHVTVTPDAGTFAGGSVRAVVYYTYLLSPL